MRSLPPISPLSSSSLSCNLNFPSATPSVCPRGRTGPASWSRPSICCFVSYTCFQVGVIRKISVPSVQSLVILFSIYSETLRYFFNTVQGPDRLGRRDGRLELLSRRVHLQVRLLRLDHHIRRGLHLLLPGGSPHMPQLLLLLTEIIHATSQFLFLLLIGLQLLHLEFLRTQ